MTGRPRIDIERDIRHSLLGLAGLFVLVAAAAWILTRWHMLPSEVPMHFDDAGEPDGFGPKYTLLIIPGIALVLWAGLGVLTRFPHRFNYLFRITEQNAERQYGIAVSMVQWIRLCMCAVFAYIAWGSTRVALGEAKVLDTSVVLVLTASVFVVSGIHIVQMVRSR